MTATGTGSQPTLTPDADARVPADRRSARWLNRALAAVSGGPRPFYLAVVASLAVTSLLAMALAELVRPHGTAALSGTQRHIFLAALAAFCISSVLGLASLTARGRIRPPAFLDRIVAPRERSVIWLALAAWFPFLLIVVYYRAKATFPNTVDYIYSPFDDKRWETSAFLIGTLAPAVWLATAARVLAVGRTQPSTWRAWFTGLFTRIGAADPQPAADPEPEAAPEPVAPAEPVADPGQPAGHDAADTADGRPSAARRALIVAAGIATALGLAWYFLGPPWHMTDTSLWITHQEDVWLIGFQAMAKGHLPYVGVSEMPYGPGTQLASYLLMHHVTSFSIVGFREAWALEVWAGTSILFVVFFLAFGFVRGLAVSLLSVLVYPALWVVGFHQGGTYQGYFGWYSPLRYVGMITLVLLLPAVVKRCPSRLGIAAGAAIGALWGLMSYMAQENLAGGVVGALAVAVLLLFTGSASWRAVRTALIAVLAGFLVVFVPVLAYFAVHGQLGAFLSEYLLFPTAVADGINDTSWQGSTHAPSAWTNMFHVLPFLLAGAALLSVFQLRPLRIATEWSPARVRLVVTLVATALLYQGVLLRSDQSHLTGTLLMVPAAVIVTGTALPRLLGVRRRVTAVVAGAALILTSFALLPSGSYAWASVRSQAELPYLDRQQLSADPHVATPPTLAGQRVGPGLADAPVCCENGDVSMPAFVSLMDQIHVLVGDRLAYVVDFPWAYPGIVYFIADLNPAPIATFDYDGSTMTKPQQRQFYTNFRVNELTSIRAVLTSSRTATEAQAFMRRYPHARVVKLHFGTADYFVLLR